MTDPGYRGTGRWAIMTAGVVGFGLVAFAFGSCASALIGAAHGASSVARPDERPLHPVSAYNPDQQQAPFAEATPFPTPASVRPPTIAAVARAVSAVNLTPSRTAASSTAATAAQVAVRRPTTLTFAPPYERDQAQNAQAREDLAVAPAPAAGAYVQPARYELGEQDFITVRLTTNVDSSTPGAVLGVVTVPAYDSTTHATVLIPAGTMLKGDDYNAVASHAEGGRLLLAAHELIFPNEVRFLLGSLAGADPMGAPGNPGDVNTHRGRAFGQAALYSLLGAATTALGNIGNHGTSFAFGASQLGQVLFENAEALRPTVTLPAGTIVHVYPSQPLIMRPYAEIAHD